MRWKIEFLPEAEKELEALDRHAARGILKLLKEKIEGADNPRYIGEPLRGPEFGKYWRYRVGDYRIVVSISDASITIVIVRIGHRKKVYK